MLLLLSRRNQQYARVCPDAPSRKVEVDGWKETGTCGGGPLLHPAFRSGHLRTATVPQPMTAVDHLVLHLASDPFDPDMVTYSNHRAQFLLGQDGHRKCGFSMAGLTRRQILCSRAAAAFVRITFATAVIVPRRLKASSPLPCPGRVEVLSKFVI